MDGQLMDDKVSQSLQSVYLVIEPDPLLRVDLAEILQYGDLWAVVIATASTEDALPHLAMTDHIRLALISASPKGFAASTLGQMIAQKGGKAVLMGGAAETEGEAMGYRVLERPFVQKQVLALL